MPGRTQSQPRKTNRQSGRRGFAAMDPEKRRKLASIGGRSSHRGSERDDKDRDDREGDRTRRGHSESRKSYGSMSPEDQRRSTSGRRRESNANPRGSSFGDDRQYGRDKNDEYENDSESRSETRSRRSYSDLNPEERRDLSVHGGPSRRGNDRDEEHRENHYEDLEQDYDDDDDFDDEEDDRH